MMEQAAVNIQKLYRGYRSRKATAHGTHGAGAAASAAAKHPPGSGHHGLFAHIKTPMKAKPVANPQTMLER